MIITKISDVTVAICDIASTTDVKRSVREHHAVDALVAALLGDGTVVRHRPDGAPYVDSGIFISITHSRDVAAMAVCKAHAVGIDAETWRPTLRKVASKFLSDREMSDFNTDSQLLKAWTIKEAVYKIAGGDALRFRDVIDIAPDLASASAMGTTYDIIDIPHPTDTVTLAIPRPHP